ncbi:hypothetical protein LTR78_006957 [Recurvomyces mirabilis]|uniref:Zn(2)-C6 fungal-type domain-containing protein n=1 Tax=Recurvomyces mirabilis TaxID=574656 RepID=A0AAE1BZ27_9PEZI|nr:hypothetical protein LTR78_006957 [Recurvomyces mirabilis]KAK5153341.1 hypothetical protein LTS14_007510 [Recurvomyces mirabilis]
MSNIMPGGAHSSIARDTGVGLPSGLGIDGEGYENSDQSGMDGSQLSPTTSNEKRRKSSKYKSNKHLGRAVSTPHMRDGAMSDDDKKRNKLGYQRISIACAHCRRRKIRCVIADADPQQRCQNCIRLKKECVFYPVEQQNALDNRTESSSKAVTDSGPSSVVSVSPPNNATDRSFESTREFPPFAALPSNASSTFQGLPLEPGSAIFGQGYAMKDYTYRSDAYGRTWPSTTSMVTDSSDTTSASSYSRYSHAPSVNGDFSPFPANEPVQTSPHNPHPPSFDYAMGRNDMSWQPQSHHHHQHHQQQQQQQQQPPLRSMSYGHIDQSQNNHVPYTPSYPAIARSPMLAMQYQPPVLHTQGMPPMSQQLAPHSAPVGTGNPAFAQPLPYAFTHHAEAIETNHGAAPMVSQAFANPWYNERPGFASLTEELDSDEGATRRR